MERLAGMRGDVGCENTESSPLTWTQKGVGTREGEAHGRISPTQRGGGLGQQRKKQCYSDSEVGETHGHLGEILGFKWALVSHAARVGTRAPWPPAGQTRQDKNSELDTACWEGRVQKVSREGL